MANTQDPAGARRIPAPQPHFETKAYWDAAASGRLIVRRCRTCGEAHHYPRTICPHCFSADTEWIDASGREQCLESLFGRLVSEQACTPGDHTWSAALRTARARSSAAQRSQCDATPAGSRDTFEDAPFSHRHPDGAGLLATGSRATLRRSP